MQSSMSNVAGKLGRRSSLGIFALLLFGFPGLQHARAAGLPNEPIMAAGAGPQFAIADLDAHPGVDRAAMLGGRFAGVNAGADSSRFCVRTAATTRVANDRTRAGA